MGFREGKQPSFYSESALILFILREPSFEYRKNAMLLKWLHLNKFNQTITLFALTKPDLLELYLYNNTGKTASCVGDLHLHFFFF